jgi:hypothetical protein
MHLLAFVLLLIIFYIEYWIKEEFSKEEMIVKGTTIIMIVIGSII